MIKGGPKIVNDGLVLCLDAHDAKSYAGEPTTNLSPNSNYSGASLDTINSGSNGGWGTTFDRWISEIEGPGGKTVKAFYLKLTGSTGSAPHAEGGAYEISGIDSQYASLTSGNSYRVSAWAKVIRADGSSSAKTSSNLLYLTGTASIGSSALTVNTTWTRISASFSISTTGNYRLRHYFYGVSVGDILVITEPQIELKSYNTPYVLSSRSATNGWVDRSGNSNSGTLTNMIGTEASHYRDGQVIMPVSASYLRFDGSDDKIQVDNIPQIFDGSVTMESWFFWDDDTRSVIFGNYNQGAGGHDVNFEKLTSRVLRIYWNRGERDVTTSANAVTTSGEWQHVVMVRDASNDNFKFYVNGSLIQTTSNAGSDITSTGSTFRIGADTRDGTTVTNGGVGVLRLYSKALTAAEVLSNYNATKGRFS